MQQNTKQILKGSLFVILAYATLISILVLSSCSDARIIQKSIAKATKHGYVVTVDTVSVTLYDTIKGKDGRDSIIETQVKIPCPEVKLPDTPRQTRIKEKQETKRARIESKHEERMFKLETNRLVKLGKQLTKQISIHSAEARKLAKLNYKQETANNKSLNLFLIVLALVVLLLLAFKFSK